MPVFGRSTILVQDQSHQRKGIPRVYPFVNEEGKKEYMLTVQQRRSLLVDGLVFYANSAE